MVRKGSGKQRSGSTAGLMLAGAVAMLALPSAVLAFSTGISIAPQEEPQNAETMRALRAPQVDPALAQAISMRMVPQGQAFRFTPAGTATRPDRSITVAVRVDPNTAKAINVRPGAEGSSSLSAAPQLRIAPTAFNLGVSRGYKAFSPTSVVSSEMRKVEMPDLSTYRPGGAHENSRFSTRLSVDESESTGRAPRTFETAGLQTVDVGGSYRLTGNLKVTAGVRYSPERDRLAPLTDGNQDSQAVYLGTQFRF